MQGSCGEQGALSGCPSLGYAREGAIGDLVTLGATGGGYEFIPGQPFASNGVVATPGMTIHHSVFTEPLLLPEGYEAVREYLDGVGRPLAALCGFDLLLPAARSVEDFLAFNAEYLAQLGAWGLLRDGSSPLARTNVAPAFGAPLRPAVRAFSYTVDGDSAVKTFVVSGVAEVPDNPTGPHDVVRLGETSADALLDKLQFVVGAVADRMSALGAPWDNAAAVHLYSTHDVAFPLVRQVLSERAIVPVHGIVWHDAAPPLDVLELEVDIRRYGRETTVA
jgi:hypothetical protein